MAWPLSISFSKFGHRNIYIEIFATKIQVFQMFGDKDYVLEFLLKTSVYLVAQLTLYAAGLTPFKANLAQKLTCQLHTY